jgi:hypothetical protein
MPCCRAVSCSAALQVLPKVKQQLQATQRDVATVAADLQRGVHRNIREMSQQLEVSGAYQPVLTCEGWAYVLTCVGHMRAKIGLCSVRDRRKSVATF